MRNLRISADSAGWKIEEKGWFIWHTLVRGFSDPKDAQFVIDSIKDQPK